MDCIDCYLQMKETFEFVNREKTLRTKQFLVIGKYSWDNNNKLIKRRQGTIVYRCVKTWIYCHM